MIIFIIGVMNVVWNNDNHFKLVDDYDGDGYDNEVNGDNGDDDNDNNVDDDDDDNDNDNNGDDDDDDDDNYGNDVDFHISIWSAFQAGRWMADRILSAPRTRNSPSRNPRRHHFL